MPVDHVRLINSVVDWGEFQYLPLWKRLLIAFFPKRYNHYLIDKNPDLGDYSFNIGDIQVQFRQFSEYTIDPDLTVRTP